ncbi:unnamed protein product [Urochloa decumbens]|uniref:DUF1618 domain-containing protein n=1 Tax=Urochloa decumbens TaxID=240449 RepID=A0ABC9D8G3_9POAL
MPDDTDSVNDHCNGLVLYDDDRDEFVLNPATRRQALLPRPSDEHAIWRYAGAYLAFDPSIWLHYKVFLVPDVDPCPNTDAEWPPAIYKLPVFSSMSGCWEESAFLRQGGHVGTVAEMQSDSRAPVCWGPQRRYAELWRGALYVHCRGAYVMSYILVPKLRVWALDDSGEQMYWVLKYHINLEALYRHVNAITRWPYRKQINHPWAIPYNRSNKEYDEADEWNSDNDDDVLDIKENNSAWGSERLDFIGFHPYKEIVFLVEGFDMVTYNLNASKAQFLGNVFPDDYDGHCASLEESFIYTPCFVDSLPKMDL